MNTLTKAQKEKLVNLYCYLKKDAHFYTDLNGFKKEQIKRGGYCADAPTEDQLEMWMRLLSGDGYHLVYLGVMLALRKGDMRYLDDALYTATTMMQFTVLSSGYDHCIYAWNLLPVLLSANRFDDIKHIFPKENGLSKNGARVLKLITNLVMYLYYGEEEWRAEAVDEAKGFSKKAPIEHRAIVDALLSLVDKNFDRFAVELVNICKGKRRTSGYSENRFTKQFPFFALGLYNFARRLYGEEVENIALPDGAGLLIELHEYQKANGYATGNNIADFKETLPILDALLNMELPSMYLVYDKRFGYTDIGGYKRDVIEMVLKSLARE